MDQTPLPNKHTFGKTPRQSVAVIGSGISGMSAAWLLSSAHDVTVFEKEGRIGGHSNTVFAPVPGHAEPIAVDTGFIVYNTLNYPNLIALFEHLGVPTQPSNMSFSASLDRGRLEYAGNNMFTLFAQKRNLFRPRYWRMLSEIKRFYGAAPSLLARPDAETLTLGEYLKSEGYSDALVMDHLLPMGAAIWSSSVEEMAAYPAAAFVRFFESHGLLRITNRPEWRTVDGGSREYVRRITERYADKVQLANGAKSIRRKGGVVFIEDNNGVIHRFDKVLIATHGDEALSLLSDPTKDERELLGNFRYQANETILHRDPTHMPRRKSVWASWNYLTQKQEHDTKVCVTYWMNLLQNLPTKEPILVTLNPFDEIDPRTEMARFSYMHPIFDQGAIAAQRDLWRLQGVNQTWFAGSYFGHGFHEDGLQAGLAAAEDLGGVRRPWTVEGESNRIYLAPARKVAA